MVLVTRMLQAAYSQGKEDNEEIFSPKNKAKKKEMSWKNGTYAHHGIGTHLQNSSCSHILEKTRGTKEEMWTIRDWQTSPVQKVMKSIAATKR